MSYLDRNPIGLRKTTFIVVTVIEAAAIYAVIQGLNVKFTRQLPPPPFVGTQVKLDPPSPPVPHPTPTARPSPSDTHITTRPNDFGPNDFGMVVATFPVTPQPVPSPGPVPMASPDPIVEPPKPPQFTPRAPRALGRPSAWATTNDYPTRDLREGNSGVTGFRLTIGSDGKVQSCAITASSGFPGLDRATCDNAVRRARFEPATDASGANVAGSYANNIRWVIPE